MQPGFTGKEHFILETRRLKNIIIVILLILNFFLLFLVLSRYYIRHQSEQELIHQTVTLLQNNQISVDPALLNADKHPLTYFNERNSEEERVFATRLLDTISTQRDNGGGTYLYANESGNATFRSNGAFTLNMYTPFLYAADYKDFIQDYCPKNYRFTQIAEENDCVVVKATAYIKEIPIYNASIDFVFKNHYLISADGFFVPASISNQSSDSGSLIEKCSAVIDWMDYCIKEGRISNTINAISSGYFLQSTTSVPLLLSPVYKIDTNTYSYYVNAANGHVYIA